MRHNTTAHVSLYARRCINCGKCAETCPKEVIGRVNSPIHKHAHIDRPDLCVGCLKCVKACPKEAIVARTGS
ncbi:MAG: 4Fe-4S binding protein [Oscillospiraceae bacterium]|nr:4Fe-4S binding protein [Oscillospiraceae bacterium]